MSKAVFPVDEFTLEPLKKKKKAITTFAKPKVSHLPLLQLDDVDARDTLMHTFAQAVLLRRGHGTLTDAQFAAWLANRLPVTAVDSFGNIHVDMRENENNRTLFTAHIDTVHHNGGANKVRVDGKFWRADSAALGADDGAGVALLAHMIYHGVKAYYIFFRGEECGGVGSSGLYENNTDLFGCFDRAIAFDRAGYSDVITHQGGRRCASDEFAQMLSNALTPDDFSMAFMPCDSGVYTDTAEFVDTVPECTNISVGYFSQHGENEHQDIDFLQKLAAQLLLVEWDELPTKRNPAEVDDKWSYGYSRSYDRVDTPTRNYKDDVILSDLDKSVIRACELYLKSVAFKDLHDLIAEWVLPDDPVLAKRHLDFGRLTDDDVREAMLSIEFGWGAEAILEDMVDICRM